MTEVWYKVVEWPANRVVRFVGSAHRTFDGAFNEMCQLRLRFEYHGIRLGVLSTEDLEARTP